MIDHHINVAIREGIHPSRSLEDLISEDPFLRRHKDSLTLFSNFKVDISSSAFRRTHDASLLVPAVHEYIKAHGLYGTQKKEG